MRGWSGGVRSDGGGRNGGGFEGGGALEGRSGDGRRSHGWWCDLLPLGLLCVFSLLDPDRRSVLEATTVVL